MFGYIRFSKESQCTKSVKSFLKFHLLVFISYFKISKKNQDENNPTVQK